MRKLTMWALVAGMAVASGACDKKAASPGKAAATEHKGDKKAGAKKAADDKAGDKKAADDKAGDKKAADDKAGAKKAADDKAGAKKAADDKAATPPAEFTFVDSPQLAQIPAKPVHGVVKGKPFAAATKVELKYSSSDWTIDLYFEGKQHFHIPLSDKLEPPTAGYKVVAAKKCCPGYLHRAKDDGSGLTSVNSPNGRAVEITKWDVKPYDPKGGMTQPGGTVAGRLAVAYDKDNWVAGTFEIPFEYFGPPPLVRAAKDAEARNKAIEALAPYKGLKAPEGLALKPNMDVWAAMRGQKYWTLASGRIQEIQDGLLIFDGNRLSVPGLVLNPKPLDAVTKGQAVVLANYRGALPAVVLKPGDKDVEVAYLGNAKRHQTKTVKLKDLYPVAQSFQDAGWPPVVFFKDAKGNARAGRAIAAQGDKLVVLLTGGKGLATVAAADATLTTPTKRLKKGTKVQAYIGCGMNSWEPRDGKITGVLEDGVGYEVNAPPCKGTVSVDYAVKR